MDADASTDTIIDDIPNQQYATPNSESFSLKVRVDADASSTLFLSLTRAFPPRVDSNILSILSPPLSLSPLPLSPLSDRSIVLFLSLFSEKCIVFLA